MKSKNETQSLYGIIPTDMYLLMQNKKLSYERKGKKFQCYVISLHRIADFLENLNAAIEELPEGYRFQIAVGVKTSFLEHWFIVDFYLKEGVFNTLTIDAFNMHGPLDTYFKLLKNALPNGKHYYFDGRHGNIQYSGNHCQTFVREHATLLTRIPPRDLYEMLEKNTTLEQTKYSGVKMVTLNDFSKEGMELLTPLLRSIQSLKAFAKLPPSIQKTRVSPKNKDNTLKEWIEHKRVFCTDRNSFLNFSINRKDAKYARELAQSKETQSIGFDEYLSRSQEIVP